jgi:hypothetical protein
VSAGRRDGWVIVGMLVAAASAAVASFTGLRSLARAAGWPVQLAWLLPLTIDAYAMTAARVWLTGSTRVRGFARANAVGAIAVSILGNATYHLIAAELITMAWPIVVLVGAVPAAVLGLTAHLHAIRGVETDPKSGPQTRTKRRTRRRTGERTDADLIAAAREADVAYRAEHNGRAITRDALRAALRIAGPRATEIRRQLVEEAQETVANNRKEANTNR